MDILTTSQLERYLLALALTFGLLALVGWLATRYGHRLNQGFTGFRPPRANGLKLLETIPLTPSHRLHKIQDGLRTHLFITHPQGVQVISSGIETAHIRTQEEEPLPSYVAPRPGKNRPE